VSGGFNETGSYSISTNSLYEVVLNEIVTVGTHNNGFGEGAGTVQGTSFIDPTFTVPAGFQLDLSPGVGNSSTAPEPGDWMMVAAGLALLVFTRAIRAFAQAR
jgi:MYXO-CTERM domain-containing protein